VPGVKSLFTDKLRVRSDGLTIFQRLVDAAFRPMVLGRLEMILPSGRVLLYGDGKEPVFAKITIRRNDFFRKCVFFGDVGFGEAYVDGDWDTDDITAVIYWMILNVDAHPTLMADSTKRAPVNFLKLANNLLIPWRKNSRMGSRRNIEAHYDLGNRFYELFLDASMTYSSAIFRDDTESLERAQFRKFEELCRKMRLVPEDRLLEIGCGWGGFALYAARHFGCRVRAVTVSPQQFDYVCERVRLEGLSDRITVELKDYRDVLGQFDKIVSIEMLEAVGHDYYRAFFSQCHRLLAPRGLLGLQVILCPDHRYHSFRNNMDWIQKYIFPGSLLPSLAVLHQAVNATGTLNFMDLEDITSHYVITLRKWRDEFNRRQSDVLDQGFNEAFIRKWSYYLSYCEAAFASRNISVAQMILSRPNNHSLHQFLR
jgi:cyclopropane-fatty-acyl-phospholipid synthase